MLIRCARDADFSGIKELFGSAGSASSTGEWTLANPAAADDGPDRFSTHFVVQENDRLVGYAGYRSRSGSDAVIEHGIRLGTAVNDKNSALTLLAALVENARVRGFRRMIATIRQGNAASIAIHERLGFVRANLAEASAAGMVAMTLDLNARDGAGQLRLT